MTTKQLALRPYLEVLEKHCRLLDRDSLLQVFLNMAKQIKPDKRNDFLHSFLTELPGTEKQMAVSSRTADTALLEEIEDFHQEIKVRLKSIDDGTYWDDPDDDDWDDDYYRDEDPDLLNEYQLDAVCDFIKEADNRFLQGKKQSAQKIYNALFLKLNEVEEHGYLPDFKVDLQEVIARFARCVYELSADEERVDAMMTVMKVDSREIDFAGIYNQNLPLLQDIMDAETGDLPDFESFLNSWQAALTKYNFRKARIAYLLLEATFMQGGVSAVGNLACSWKEQQPLGYLYWLAKLESEGAWEELSDAVKKSFMVLPPGNDRCKAASFLIKAGEMLGLDQAIITGYRERFMARPNDASLLELVKEAARQQTRELELEKACVFLAQKKTEFGEQKLLVKSLLMFGELEEAFVMCSQNNDVKLSLDSMTGLLYAGVLYLLGGRKADCNLVHNLLDDYAGGRVVYFNSYDERISAPGTSGYKEIMRGLDLIDIGSLDLNRYREWAENLGKNQVHSIVSNKYRTGYPQAAMILGSLAETLTLEGEEDKARTLLHKFCKEQYNRHVAFRREVREVVKNSKYLKGMVAGL
jgi:hypothetical protein